MRPFACRQKIFTGGISPEPLGLRQGRRHFKSAILTGPQALATRSPLARQRHFLQPLVRRLKGRGDEVFLAAGSVNRIEYFSMQSTVSHPGILWFLALDTSTEILSLAVGAPDREADALSAGEPPSRLWQYTGAGASQSSATLIPEALRLLRQADLRLQDLQAIVAGMGPGSFTGLRTVCAVAQGLALGSGLPVLPVSTLQAVAEDWRWQQAAQVPQGRVWAMLDARMEEIYAACWQWHRQADGTVQWQCLHAPVLVAPENLLALPGLRADDALAGNVRAVYGARLPRPVAAARPDATALLRLAPGLWRQGAAVDAALVLPHYVRDKVAQTTAERAALQVARSATA